jgi:hypothetical protein
MGQQQTAGDVLPFTPRHTDGDFYIAPPSGLPYAMEITDWQAKEPIYKKGVGQIETAIVSMEDIGVDEEVNKASRFVFRKFVPDDQRWDVSTDRTLPLSIRVKGYDTYLGLQLAEKRIHNRTVGTNQEHGHNLLHDAQATMAILDYDDQLQKEQGKVTCSPNQSNFTGYSMGTMKLLAMLGLAPQMGREVGFSIGLDPCLAKKVDYQEELADPVELIKYLGSEALEIPKNLARNIHLRTLVSDLVRTRHFIDSVGFTPEYVRNVYDKWNVLATGEARNFPPKVPKEAVVIIHFFNGCRWNDSDEYDRLFEGHPNVRRIHEDGLHLVGADPEVIGKVVDKDVLALELTDQGVSPDELADALEEPILLAA